MKVNLNGRKMTIPHGKVGGKRSSYLVIFFSIISIFLIFGDGNIMASDKKPKYAYWLGFSMENAMADIRVNGVSILKYTRAKENTQSRPVAHLLRNGLNTITVNFVPAIYKDNSVFIIDDANEGFFVNLRLDLMTPDGQEYIDLGYIDFNKERNKYEVLKKSLVNSEYKSSYKNVSFSNVSEFHKSQFINNKAKKFDSVEVSFVVEIDDEGFKDVIWSEGDEIELSEDVKNKVIDKYKQMISTIERDDKDEFVQYFYKVWENTVEVYGIDDGIAYYVDDDRHSQPSKIGEGLPLKKFDYNETNYKFELTAENHLIRLVPTPLIWGGRFTFKPVFYIDDNGNVQVAAVINE